MKTTKRWTACILSLMMFLFALCGNTVTARAEGGSISASSDGSYIYLTYTGPWSMYFQEMVNVSVNGSAASGEKSQIVVRGDSVLETQVMTVRDAWSGEIPGSTATLVNEGRIEEPYQPMRFTTSTLYIAVPVSYYGEDVESVGLSYGGQYVEVTTKFEETTPEETTPTVPGSESNENPEVPATPTNAEPGSETAEPEVPGSPTVPGSESTENPEVPGTPIVPGSESDDNTTENQDPGKLPDLNVDSAMAIDGHYDEWKDLPVTTITYENNNGVADHSGQMYVSGDRVYVHYSLHNLYEATVKMQEMTIVADGQSVKLGLYPVSGDGQIDWNRYNQENVNRTAGSYTNYRVSVGYYDLLDSDGYITVYDSGHEAGYQSDEVEFSFSLSDFKRAAGISGDVTNLTLYNPNIGREGITWVGTPTGPIVGVIILLVCAGVGYVVFTKKKKEEQIV